MEDRRERYDELYAIFQQLYPATVQHSHALARLQRDDAVVAEGDRGT